MKYLIIGLKDEYLFDTISDGNNINEFILQKEHIPIDEQRLLIGGRDIDICNIPNNNNNCDEITKVKVALKLNGGMAKKKGKGKGKGKKDKKKKKDKEEEAKPDEFDFMNIDELTKIKKVLTERLSKIEEERSYFQFERDFLQKMYDIIHEYEYCENIINFKNMESDIELLKNNHRNNIRMYVQKVKHLEYDHQNTMNSISMEAQLLQNDEKSNHQIKKEKLITNRKILESESLKTKILNEEEIKEIEKKFSEKEISVKMEFENKYIELEKNYNLIENELKSDLNLQTKLQIHEIEERKNLHINDLIFNHSKSFDKMKNYYNSITRDNLDLIRSLKTELNELEEKIKNHEIKYQQILQENKKLNLPLNKAKNEVMIYNKKLINYNKDKRSLKSNQKHLLSLTNKLNILKKENIILKNKYQDVIKLKNDKINKYSTISNTICFDEDQKQKLIELQNKFKLKQNQLNKILNDANLDKVVINHLTNKLNKIIDHKNHQISDKRYDIIKYQKMHDDLVRVYQSKIKQLSPNVPDDELFHIQHINNVQGATVPAGFVTD